MANLHDKPILSVATQEDDKLALFRRAAQVARTSHLLINQTEELLARTRQLLKKSAGKPLRD
jgi:hypothetical protein